MRGLLKRTLLCLTAASSLAMGGNIYADDTSPEGTSAVSDDAVEEASPERRAKRSEAAESPSFDAARMRELFVSAGKDGGLDVYVRDDEAIWAAHGGKPEKGEKLDDERKAAKEAAEDEIKEAKKIGDAAALDEKTGAPAAAFDKLSKNGETQLYISEKGRYIVGVDDSGKLTVTESVISTLDSGNVFLMDEGKTLERRSSDNKKSDSLYTYTSTENGMRVYSEDGGEHFAWVSEEMDRFYGIYRFGAESDQLRMIVDDRNAVFGLENKETGYIWWSSPLGATQDTYATQILVDGLRSSATMNYVIPETRSENNTLRSGAENDCSIKVKDIKNGIRVVYDFKKAGFSYPVEYVLEDDHLRASLKISDIKETNSKNLISEISLLGNLGAASSEEDGYFIIPDGSGALVRFNNNRTMVQNAYSQKVYGNDLAFVPTSRGAVTEQIYMPVYGIVKEDNAMLVIASHGDTNASLSVRTSKQSNTDYNMCGFTFKLRETDKYYMPGSSAEQFTVFETGDIRSDDIELLCYPIAKEDADYVDVAECYRNYLLTKGGVQKRAEEGKAPLYVDLYGGVQKKVPILGIPVTVKRSVTSYSQAETILRDLQNYGVDEMVVSYGNWTNDGIKNKIDTKAKPSGTLGGKRDFSDLKNYLGDSGIEFYPVSDNSCFYSGNGYFSFTDTSVRVSGNFSRIVSYDRAYGIPDGFKKNMSLLSPSRFDKVFGDLEKNYPKAGLGGISLSDLTSSLYGDYGKRKVSRYDAAKKLTSGYEKLDSALENGILADTANAYAFPFVSHITHVPLSSSGFDIFDEDIPFFQLVMHGVIPYSSRAVNGDPEPSRLILEAASAGSCLSCDLLYEATSELKDTEYDIYYYANHSRQAEKAAEAYKLVKPVLSSVSGSYITSYKRENGRIETSYSNGDVVVTDLDEGFIELNGQRSFIPDYNNGEEEKN